MGSCTHSRFHSGGARYSRATERLRYVVVCDDCQGEVREIAAVDYRPRFEPNGSPLAALMQAGA